MVTSRAMILSRRSGGPSVFLFNLVLWFSLGACPVHAGGNLTWLPELRVAIVGQSDWVLNQTSVGDLMSKAAFEVPSDHLLLFVQAGPAKLNLQGQMAFTSFHLGHRVGQSSDLIEVLQSAPFSIKEFKGVILATAFGARKLADGTPSLAQDLAEGMGLPVLAPTGRIEAVMGPGIMIDSGRASVEMMVHPLVTRTPSGARRVSPWTIEAPKGETGPWPELEEVQQQLTQKHEIAAFIAGEPGDLRPKTLPLRMFPSLLALIPPSYSTPKKLKAQRMINGEWERFNLDLFQSRVVVMAEASFKPTAGMTLPLRHESMWSRMSLKSFLHGFEMLVESGSSPQAVVLPLLDPSFFRKGEMSLPQQLANKTRRVVLTPSAPRESQAAHLLEWRGQVDWQNWTVYRPRLTPLTYYEDEVEELRLKLNEGFKHGRMRSIDELTCQGKLLNYFYRQKK